jgi:glycosyltransferase involved in cell wall biosynthesis
MKKVLIIANLFHTSSRIPGLTSYSPEFGWEATVITSPINTDDAKKLGLSPRFFTKTKIVEAPYRGDVLWPIRKMMKIMGFKREGSLTEQLKEIFGDKSKKGLIDKLLLLYQSIFGFPDTEKSWLKPALRKAEEILEKERYNAVLSSSPYPTSHLIAKKIKKKFNMPWVADFRDPWSQNHNYPYGPIRKILDTKLEKKTIKNADAIDAASPGYAEKQQKLHQKSVSVITNGFDPEIIENLNIPLTKKFTITYTGAVYKWKQNPTIILGATKELIEEKKINPAEIEIRFYGAKLLWLEKEIKKYGLENIAIQYGSIAKEESLKRQKESQLLLLLCWEDLKETGVYPKKIFEYLASQRPILATGGSKKEDVKNIIKETNSGVSAITIEETKNNLLIFYQEYKQSGAIPYHGDIQKVDQYSYRSMAKKFADILNQITI